MYRCSLLYLSLFNFHNLDISYTVKIEEDKNDLFCFKSDGLMDSLSTQVLRESISPSHHPIMIIIISFIFIHIAIFIVALVITMNNVISLVTLVALYSTLVGRFEAWDLFIHQYWKLHFHNHLHLLHDHDHHSSLVAGHGLRTSLITRRRVTVGQWTTCKHQQHQH